MESIERRNRDSLTEPEQAYDKTMTGIARDHSKMIEYGAKTQTQEEDLPE